MIKDIKKAKKICCFCGVNEGTTKDHVPPKSFFNKPIEAPLVTVPACLSCNNYYSKYDEIFKVYLGMQVAYQGGEAERLFKEGTLSSVKNNNSLRKKILNDMEPVDIVTPSGIFLKRGATALWDSEAFEKTIERITRGLFYHHYKSILPPDTLIQTHWANKLPDFIDADKLYYNSIGGNSFQYQYNKIEEEPAMSAWIYQFYNGFWSMALVGMDKLPTDLL